MDAVQCTRLVYLTLHPETGFIYFHVHPFCGIQFIAMKKELTSIAVLLLHSLKIAVESPRFRGLSLVKQHKLVKSAISTEVCGMPQPCV